MRPRDRIADPGPIHSRAFRFSPPLCSIEATLLEPPRGHDNGIACPRKLMPLCACSQTKFGGEMAITYTLQKAALESGLSIRTLQYRSEERRVGKECRSRWS